MTISDMRALITKWQPRLGLAAWRIALLVEDEAKDDPSAEMTLMSVERPSDYNDAVFRCHPGVVGEAELNCVENAIREQFGSDAYFERKVVHELLHLALRDLTTVAFDLASRHIGRDAYEGFEAAWGHAEEATVDNLAVALTGDWSK